MGARSHPSKMLRIRPAIVNDTALLLAMIRELAEFERVPDKVKVSVEDLVRDGFGESPRFRALIAEWGEKAAGYAIFLRLLFHLRRFRSVSRGCIRARSVRGRGIGAALMADVAKVAVNENRYGIQWSVLNWNGKAIV